MEIPVEEGLLAMVTNRLVDPRSKLSTYRWLQGVYAPEWEREYIVGIPLRKWKASDEVLKRAGRYHKAAENLEVKEVEQGGKRYVLCYNPEQAERDRKERASFVAQIEAELARGGLGGLARKKGYGRYLHPPPSGDCPGIQGAMASGAGFPGAKEWA